MTALRSGPDSIQNQRPSHHWMKVQCWVIVGGTDCRIIVIRYSAQSSVEDWQGLQGILQLRQNPRMRLRTVAVWCTIGLLAGCAGTPDPAKLAAQQHEGSAQILANKNKKGSLLLVRMVDSPLLGDVDCSGYITLRRVNAGSQTRRSRLYLSVPRLRIACKTQTNWCSASCSPRLRKNMHDGSCPSPLVAMS